MEMHLAGVSIRRVEKTTNKWFTSFVHFDGIVLKRSWIGEVLNVSVLIAVGVS